MIVRTGCGHERAIAAPVLAMAAARWGDTWRPRWCSACYAAVSTVPIKRPPHFAAVGRQTRHACACEAARRCRQNGGNAADCRAAFERELSVRETIAAIQGVLGGQ